MRAIDGQPRSGCEHALRRLTGYGMSLTAFRHQRASTHELYKSVFAPSSSSLSPHLAAQRPRPRASRLRYPAMITTSRPPSVHSTTPDADPFSAFLRPPASETEHERVARLQREADAKRISDSIDEEIKADRERLRKSKQDIRVSIPSHDIPVLRPPPAHQTQRLASLEL